MHKNNWNQGGVIQSPGGPPDSKVILGSDLSRHSSERKLSEAQYCRQLEVGGVPSQGLYRLNTHTHTHTHTHNTIISALLDLFHITVG